MKKILLSLIVITVSVFLFAQTPNQFKYQAVLRNTDGTIMAEESVTIIISILKSDLTTSVFEETHNITTTTLGLINLNIGSKEDLSVVDWTLDEYFIEISVNGTVIGTSQLLSVPYALQAKTAETADYNDLTNQPINATTSTDGFMSSADKTKLDGLTNADGSETSVTAGTNVNVTGVGTTASPYVINATGATALAIGDSYQGGIIFWLDATGQHGLIAATADQSTSMQWYNGTHRYTGSSGDGFYAGAMNTAMIVATQMADNQTGNFAAKVCADYSVTVGGVTYGDWYLLSKYELNLLYLQKTAVGGFASTSYWSSSEYNDNSAWIQNFSSGTHYASTKYFTYCVRAIRAF